MSTASKSGALENAVQSLHHGPRASAHQLGWGVFGVLVLRDIELAMSSARSALLATIIAKTQSVDVTGATYWSFLLHDVGMLDTPESILGKPGPLTPNEQGIIGVHTLRSAQLLESVPGLAQVAGIVLHHHERWDGKGYPAGLAGEEIPIGARMLAVADAFVALTEPRRYRPACSAEEAMEVIVDAEGTQFDPNLATAFAHIDVPDALRRQPHIGVIGEEAERMVSMADRASSLSRAQLEALFASALGLDAEEAAQRFGRSPGTQRNWASSLRRTLSCPSRVPLPRFLAGVGRRLYEAVAGATG